MDQKFDALNLMYSSEIKVIGSFKCAKIYPRKGPYFNYVSTFLTIFDQLSNPVSMFTKYALFTKLAFWPILLTN